MFLSSASLTFAEFTVGDVNVKKSLDIHRLGTAGEVPIMSKLPPLEPKPAIFLIQYFLNV